MKIVAAVLLMASLVQAEDMTDLIKQLGHEDFDVREEATDKLGDYPAEFADKFLTMSMSKDLDDLEIRMRLRHAARFVFERSIGAKDPRWLILHGDIGFEGSLLYIEKVTEEEAKEEPEDKEEKVEKEDDGNGGLMESIRRYIHREWILVGFAVNFVNLEGPCDGKLDRWDIIEKIDGLELSYMSGQKWPEADKEYEITFRRYKKTDLIEMNDLDLKDKDYEVKKIKVKAGWKDRRFINELEEQALMETMWQQWLVDRAAREAIERSETNVEKS